MIMGIILLLFGGLLIANPKLIWFITESWKTENSTDPSSFYTVTTRIGGILLALFAIFTIYVSTW
ncbi:hypothetical protein CN692_19690 [Bacillus sp. AFS002410]|uniref:DUF6199 family natural product biosynthesis protein n=1 Tax=Bacillus sp. AFS002410 TaxID=2033481 RepID=UPI000BF15873|nr:DUF6199 family natural product biosynthesis protein [Bacillus sp. AFS002410]PEJ54556.1 hypothetical protein CN692_19690 [Bacillus sp. AFS002410]